SIVLLGPTGYSTTGEVFNLLAEEVATKTAVALKADKLIFLGQQQGLLNSKQQLLRELTPQQLDPYIEQHEQADPTQALYLRAARD
ncbi:amino-acid N-acetyltransferase, partial [Acinetobacter variabilis]